MKRFDLVELAAVVFAVAAAVGVGELRFLTQRTATPAVPARVASTAASLELDRLAAAYGPARNSEHVEEWIVRDYFNDKRGGFFVDVGANDYKRFSNTYYLDTALGWSGLAIEPLRRFEADYRRYRPRTTFLPFYVGDRSNETANLYYSPQNPLVTSSDGSWTKQWPGRVEQVSAPTITLDDLLAKEHAPHVDFVSMDIELAEPKALAGFDIERFTPGLLCIEAQPEVRQQILDYFARHKYVVDGKYLDVDMWNLYFVPLDAASAPAQ